MYMYRYFMVPDRSRFGNSYLSLFVCLSVFLSVCLSVSLSLSLSLSHTHTRIHTHAHTRKLCACCAAITMMCYIVIVLCIRIGLHTFFPILNSQIYPVFDRLGSFLYILAWVADGSWLRMALGCYAHNTKCLSLMRLLMIFMRDCYVRNTKCPSSAL